MADSVPQVPPDLRPGVPHDPALIYQEDFSSGTPKVGPDVNSVSLAAYTGLGLAAPYTAAEAWLPGWKACNGHILNAESAQPSDPGCVANGGLDKNGGSGAVQHAAWFYLRYMAYALGLAQGQAHEGALANNAVASETNGGDPQPAGVQLAADFGGGLTTQAGHYYTASAYFAAMHCRADSALGWNDPKQSFTLILEDGSRKLVGVDLNPCDSAFGIAGFNPYNAKHPTVAANNNVGSVYVSKVVAPKPVLLTEGNTIVGLEIANATNKSLGNDLAFDLPTIFDVTPRIDAEFGDAEIVLDEESTLTFTITNTSDLDAKERWSFTDGLPDGVRLAGDPNMRTTCEAVDLESGNSGTLTVTGDLPQGEAFCTVTVDVVGTEVGTWPDPLDGLDRHGLVKGNTDPSIDVVRPALTLVKSTEATQARVGEEITYAFEVTNTGTVELTDVTVVDDNGDVQVQGDPVTLAPGEKHTFTGTWVIPGDEVSDYSVDNSATATGVYQEHTVTDESAVSIPAYVTITAEYVDEYGRPVHDPTLVYDDKMGEDYASSPLDVPGYTFSKVKDGSLPQEGVAESDGVITYVYTRVPGYMSAGYVFTKEAEPPTGAEVLPGDLVTYTLTGANTGDVPLLVTVDDDLSGVLAHASAAGMVVVTLGPDGSQVEVGRFAVSDATVAWTGTVPAGESVTITYQVRVDDGAWGVELTNTADSTATPEEGDRITAPREETRHVTPAGPAFDLAKEASPASGSVVLPGDTVAYTLTGTNAGGVTSSVTVTDDLSGLLAHADLVGSITATVSGVPVAAPTLVADVLTWTGSVGPEQTVVITYEVTVKADAWGVTLVNLASATTTPSRGDPMSTDEVSTDHATPGYAFEKTASPGTGDTVQVGDRVTYTLTGANFGQTALDPVTITDDLTQVLAYATLVDGSLTAAIDGATAASAPVLSGTSLTWTGSLQAGQIVEVSYTVVVADGSEGEVLRNVAFSEVTPPDSETPIGTPEEETTHEVRGYLFTKEAQPASGTAVMPGQTVDYTLTGTNTGAVTLDPVRIADDLSKVLAYADLVGAPVATIEGVGSVPAPRVDGANLTWSGALEPGQVVRVAYQVRVHDDAWGVTLTNHATSSSTPPSGSPAPSPDVVTEHPTPGYEFAKTADPASGTAVPVGATVTFTLTGSNTGPVALLPATITDDLSGVLRHARLVSGSLDASIDGVDDIPEPTIDGGTLTWTGPLEPGQVVRVTYQVTVVDGGADATLENVAALTGTLPTGGEVPGASARTEHPVTVPPEAPDVVTRVIRALPRTGAEVAASLGALVALVGCGTWLVVGSRRRRRG
ncbi:DUF7507 domain-containing protein [Xylanimonas ulmi]|nr:isopeptide-forming domain-containing fimbrial protein [Xylanibacterium ulmi]